MREQYNNIEPLVFRLVTSVGQGKILSPHEESNLRYSNSALHYTVLPLSHRDSTVSVVYYEVHMTCFLHTTRISNADGMTRVVKHRRVEIKGLRFDSSRGPRIFFLSHARDEGKIKILSLFLNRT